MSRFQSLDLPFLMAFAIVVSNGCSTVSRHSPISCDAVDLAHASSEAVVSQALDTPVPKTIPVESVDERLESMELADYEVAPEPCQPVDKAENNVVTKVEWKPNSNPSPESKPKMFQTSAKSMPVPQSPIKSAATRITRSSQCENDVDCLPILTEWKTHYDAQSEELQLKIESLETTLKLNQEMLKRMDLALEKATSEIDRLDEEVVFYRKEVDRLEKMMLDQHTEDLSLLDALSLQLEKMLQQTQTSIETSHSDRPGGSILR